MDTGFRQLVREFLADLCEKYPDRGVSVMSSLAEGADQLVAEEAVTMRIPLIAALPMPRDIYLTDFDTTRARENFNQLLSQSSDIKEPRTSEMPQRHRRVFAHTNEFSRDAQKHEEDIHNEA